MSLIVQKYGGTSVADLERIRNVAKRVAKTFDQGNDVVVILSAMAGVTDDLIDMAVQITESPDKRELDVLLATGEQTTAALLAKDSTSKRRGTAIIAPSPPELDVAYFIVSEVSVQDQFLGACT